MLPFILYIIKKQEEIDEACCNKGEVVGVARQNREQRKEDPVFPTGVRDTFLSVDPAGGSAEKAEAVHPDFDSEEQHIRHGDQR